MRVFGIFEQVKTGASGGKDFPAKEFCKETRKREKETGFGAVPILFYENEDYGECDDDRLITIRKSDLTDFIEKYPLYISKSVADTYRMLKR